MEHDDPHEAKQPQVVNEAIKNYLAMTSAWAKWVDRTAERMQRPLIDNEDLDLAEGNDFA